MVASTRPVEFPVAGSSSWTADGELGAPASSSSTRKGPQFALLAAQAVGRSGSPAAGRDYSSGPLLKNTALPHIVESGFRARCAKASE